MENVFALRHRISQGRFVSLVPGDACPPFPGCIASFREVWCSDQCKIIFNSIRHIRMDIQRALCHVAQSQGYFSTQTLKMQVPSCSWHLIKNAMARHGIIGTAGVPNCMPRAILSWGLCYQAIRHTEHLDVLRFDTDGRLKAFRDLFGHTCGFGVQKKRPRYCDGRSVLHINDVINVASRVNNELEEIPEPSASTGTWCSFRNAVIHDGFDMAYDIDYGVLHLVIRYHK